MKLVFSFIIGWSMVWGHAQTLISPGASWKYNDTGTDLGTQWRQPDYNDDSWPEGRAQLGFGDGDETTVLQSGHVTYYFRKAFQVTNADAASSLLIRLLRDDGAVIYVNGTEVVRSNMPGGTVTYNTYAASTVAGSEEDRFFEYVVDASVLHTGTNIIAVEVHQRRITSSDVSFDLGLSFTDAQAEVFRKRPYLIYPGRNDQMTVLWQLRASGNCQLQYGTDTAYAAGTFAVSEYGNDHQFRKTLENLQPGTRYFYRVSCANGSYESSFLAAPPDDETSLWFYAYGDTRSQPWEHDSVASTILNEIRNIPASQTFIVNSGDLVADGDSETDWDEQFFSAQYPNINRLTASLPYLAAVGNHEGNGLLFAKYFPYPMFENSDAAYYSFDYGNVHFVVIDQYAPYYQGSAQYAWLTDDLASAAKPWRIALFHKPGWSAGGHGNDSDVQTLLQPLFEQYDVALAITGHNHYYARAVVNGVQHITTGGGGAPLYDPNPSYPNIVRTDRSYHFLQIHILDNNQMEIKAIRQDGSLIESFTVTNPHTAVAQEILEGIRIQSGEKKIIVHMKSGNAVMQIRDLAGRLITERRIREGKNYVYLKTAGLYLLYIRLSDGKEMNVKVPVY